MLLDLNDKLEAMLEGRLETDAAGSKPLMSSVDEWGEEAIQRANSTLEAGILSREQKDGISHPSH